MLTKKVKNRTLFLILILSVSIIVIFFIIKTLNSNLLYFRTPTDIKLSNEKTMQRNIRLGGMVKKGSISVNLDEIKFI